MTAHGLRPKKRLGQNFLIDRNALDKIAAACGVGPDTNVLEIGPGLGTLTRELAATSARVVCVEADKALEPVLNETLAGLPNIEIIISDFLKLDMDKFDGKWVVVGNLPYYITSPIIAKLIDARAHIDRVLVMVQREVARRLSAAAGSEDYGSLTVFVQFYCDVESVVRVSRNVFYPVPEVDSEMVRLTVRDRPRADVPDEALFFRVVRAAFGKRRKTLLNALSTSDELGWSRDEAAAALASSGIDAGRRGETLTIGEFAALACARR